MGRPIKKKFFGNTITPYQNHAVGGKTGTGGEGVASITTATAGSIYINNTNTSFPSLVVADPAIAGGIKATTSVVWEVDTVTITTGTGYTTGTITSITGLDTYANTPTKFTVTANGSGVPTFNAFTNRGEYTTINGTGIATWNVVGPTGTNAQATVKFRVKRIDISNPGSGYLTGPSLSWTALSGTTPSGQTPALTSGRQDAITIISYLPTASQSRTNGDILKQESSRRYLVQNSDGKGICQLSTGTLTAGKMHIIGTDFGGATYWITKLTARKARVFCRTSTSTAYVSTGQLARWTLGAATGTGVNTVISLNHTI